MVEHLDPLVYCRVPKTASTAIHSLIENTGVIDPSQALRYEARFGVFYDGFSAAISRKNSTIDALKSLLWAVPVGRFILRMKPKVNREPLIPVPPDEVENRLNFRDVGYVAGHFTMDQIQEYLKYADFILAIMFRDPLQQMISMYDNWRRYRGIAGWGIEIPYDSKVTFEEFIRRLPDYQSRFVGNYSFRERDIIGTTKRVNQFAGRMLAYLSGDEYEEIEVPPRNETKRKLTLNKLGIRQADEPEFIRWFQQLNSCDYQLWGEAQRLENAFNPQIHVRSSGISVTA